MFRYETIETHVLEILTHIILDIGGCVKIVPRTIQLPWIYWP